MRFDRAPEIESEDLLNLTSMIDVVFTLLAFFIITIRVFGNERDAVVAPSRPETSQGLVRDDLPERVTIVLIDRGAQMRILIGGREFADTGAITAQLNEINLPDVDVELAAAERVSVDQVTSAVDAVLHSTMPKVSLRRASTEELGRLSPGGAN